MPPLHEKLQECSLQSLESNKLIHVVEDNVKYGTKVHLWDGCGSPNEVWHIKTLRKVDDKLYVVTISNRTAYLNVPGANAYQGATLHMWGSTLKTDDEHDQASQWLLEYLDDNTVIIKTVLTDLYMNADTHTANNNGGIIHLWGNRANSLDWPSNKWRICPVGIVVKQSTHEHHEEESEWDMCQRKIVSHEETSLDADLEIGKIAQMVCSAVQAYFGDIFSIVQISENVKLSFSTSSSTHLTDDKIIMHQDMNYLLIKLQSKTGTNKIKTGLFKKDKTSKVYIAEVCCFRPKNKAAEDECKRLMSEKVHDVLREVKESF
jgi:hypothetical protein